MLTPFFCKACISSAVPEKRYPADATRYSIFCFLQLRITPQFSANSFVSFSASAFTAAAADCRFPVVTVRSCKRIVPASSCVAFPQDTAYDTAFSESHEDSGISSAENTADAPVFNRTRLRSLSSKTKSVVSAPEIILCVSAQKTARIVFISVPALSNTTERDIGS